MNIYKLYTLLLIILIILYIKKCNRKNKSFYVQSIKQSNTPLNAFGYDSDIYGPDGYKYRDVWCSSEDGIVLDDNNCDIELKPINKIHAIDDIGEVYI